MYSLLEKYDFKILVHMYHKAKRFNYQLVQLENIFNLKLVKAFSFMKHMH